MTLAPPSAADAVVVARGLTKRFGAVAAVQGIDVVVPRGARFGLIGQNGAGKTTFIKLLLGICRKDDGDVRVFGADPEDVSVRRRVGYLPERLAIPPSFSALSFLDGVARLKGIPAPRRTSDVKDVLATVGLEEAAWSRKTGGYSKGMRQRTGLAAALLGQPELLILDEPTDGIDPLGRRQIRDVILEAGRRGATIFLNSHLLAETERVCDHVAVLHKGRVVRAGSLSTLQKKDAFRVVFAHSATAAAVATACGFVVVDDDAHGSHAGGHAGGHGGHGGHDEVITTSFAGSDGAALSAALQQALAQGLVVVELRQELVELETVLEQSTRAPSSSPTEHPSTSQQASSSTKEQAP